MIIQLLVWFIFTCSICGFTEVSISDRKDYLRVEDYIVDVDVEHELIFEVKPLNMDKLESILLDVSDPFSPRYGNHLSRNDIADLTMNKQGLHALRQYFHLHNVAITHESLYGEFLTATAKLSTWERILSTKFYLFRHVENKRPSVLRALQYTLHDDIAPHVATLYKATRLPISESTITPITTEAKLGAQATGTITPSRFNTYYNVFSNTGSTSIKQTIYSAIGQYWSSTDLASFQSTYGIPSHPIDADPNSRNSHAQCVSNANNCGESNLDIEYITAIAQNTYTSVTYDSSSDAFITWVTSVANTASPSHVYSISYGSQESYLSSSYMTSFNTQAIKLGAMGVTVMVSSGDDGAPGYRARSSSSSCSYDPSFPASSPYVVAVGATMGPEAGATEVACDANLGGQITTGGGFSKFATRLSHQDRAIKAYFATVSTSPVSGYSTSGRGFPDVSLAGKYYETIIGGATYFSSGTSASAPAFAAMVSLVNAARLKIGKSTVGFLNPALYAYNGSFANDITSGNNKCTESVCCTQGFYTSTGWDPVTGFGSVDFTKFYNLFATTSAPTSAPVITATTTPTLPLPTREPTNIPSRSPSMEPTNQPSKDPTVIPSLMPSLPTASPTSIPSKEPTSLPTRHPSSEPTHKPTTNPSTEPSSVPTSQPNTKNPTIIPTALPSNPPPTRFPTRFPSNAPSKRPTSLPTSLPTKIPTSAPTVIPTKFPTFAPVRGPTVEPSLFPTAIPTESPTSIPTNIPIIFPTVEPTTDPTSEPSLPTSTPSSQPTPDALPSITPNARAPSIRPTRASPNAPSITVPVSPTFRPTRIPTTSPTNIPTNDPSIMPTTLPTLFPTKFPTRLPTVMPSFKPTSFPASSPTKIPSKVPSRAPTRRPTITPTRLPSRIPSVTPTLQPVSFPTSSPTKIPSKVPSRAPTRRPTITPTRLPSRIPSVTPTLRPVSFPTSSPTKIPSKVPSRAPTRRPTITPTKFPTRIPTVATTLSSTKLPSVTPVRKPTVAPTVQPTRPPTSSLTKIPTRIPSVTPATASPSKRPTVLPTPRAPVNPTPTVTPGRFPTTFPTRMVT